MEVSVSDSSTELLFSFLTLALQARGPVAYIVALAVSVLIIAVAWRLVRG
jgi:hypothetical protein